MEFVENSVLENEYKFRIYKVIDYIEKNLDKQHTLEDLATVANFSKFHFHRIFMGMIGETPFQFINRVRLEKAASLLSVPNPENISSIAMQCGFSDISIFSRNFKIYFKVPASRWKTSKILNSNLSQINSNQQQSVDRIQTYFCPDSNTIKWKTNMKQNKSVEVKELPQMTLAYVRHIGPYKGNEKLFEGLWGKLMAWAGPRGLLQQPDLKSLVVYHDDPNVTNEEKLRTSVCVSVPAETKVNGEIGKMELEAGKYVMARFDIDATEFGLAWNWVCGTWLPSSGYQPDDGPCFEMYPEAPKDGRFIVDICMPVKPM